MSEFISDFWSFYTNTWVSIWILSIVLIGFLLAFLFKKFPKSSFFVFFELFFEKIYEFFEEILGNEEKRWIKVYVTILFFIILSSNLLWIFLDFLLPIFWHHLEHFIKIPTSDINFNIAMALVWLVIILIEQFKALWFWKAIYEYFPILWKNYIPYTRGVLPKIVDFPLFLIVKSFDIIISLFLWLLEIVWHWAKIISLSFRLFWNVTSGWILLTMLMWALIWLTNNLFWIDFPVVWPVILYLQGLLVAFIQALVFPLLIAIFIKVAKVH